MDKRSKLPDNWAQLTPAQKRQHRLNSFLNPKGVDFVSPEAERAYKVRAQRLVDAYNVREPDRVPVNLPLGNLPFTSYGINMHAAMYDYDKAVRACQKFNDQHSAALECFAIPHFVPGRVLDSLDYKLYVWPGHGLAQDAPGFQFVEDEYMKADEYDALIRDPSDFWLRTYLPRVFGAFNSFGLFQPLTNMVEIIDVWQLTALATPQIQDALQRLIDVGKEYPKMMKVLRKYNRMGMANGFPGRMRGTFCKAPFDILGDTLRGTQGIMADIYRRPDKLLEALDVIADISINSVLTSPHISEIVMVIYPLHKGADGWMSTKQFETFYWPSLKKVMNAFINEGLIQSLFAEGSFNTRLEHVNEFPKGAVSWYFDQTDMSRAKRMLGDRCCLKGNVPSALMVTGSPGDVKEYCRRLIEDCGQGGGYILAAGADAENPRLENLRAMLAAAKEYGVYKK
jgi:hypothetical protein